MKSKTIILVLLLVMFLIVFGVALAQVDFAQSRWVLGGGASESTASGLNLRATLGQPIADVVTGGNGDITLRQGFWHGDSDTGPEYIINLPIVQK